MEMKQVGKSLSEIRKTVAEKNLERIKLMDEKQIHWKTCFNCINAECVPQQNSMKDNGAMLVPVFKCDEFCVVTTSFVGGSLNNVCDMFKPTDKRLLSSTWQKRCAEKTCTICRFRGENV
jgi:hypothetical protein